MSIARMFLCSLCFVFLANDMLSAQIKVIKLGEKKAPEKVEKKETDAKETDAKETPETDKETPEATDVSLGDGALQMKVPGAWDQAEPRSKIVEVEFSIKAEEGDENNGRLTMMGATGGVDANIARWIGQFKQEDGSDTKDKAAIEEKTVSELPVHVVRISGNFMDSPRGPFGPKVERKDYRMLAAIVEVDKAHYFLKLYGPSKTIAAHEAAFDEMVNSFAGKKE